MLFGFTLTVDDFRVSTGSFDLLDGLELDDACLFIMIPFNFQCYEDAHSFADHLGRNGHWDTTHQIGNT